jgi:hypothetical protein
LEYYFASGGLKANLTLLAIKLRLKVPENDVVNKKSAGVMRAPGVAARRGKRLDLGGVKQPAR